MIAGKTDKPSAVASINDTLSNSNSNVNIICEKDDIGFLEKKKNL